MLCGDPYFLYGKEILSCYPIKITITLGHLLAVENQQEQDYAPAKIILHYPNGNRPRWANP